MRKDRRRGERGSIDDIRDIAGFYNRNPGGENYRLTDRQLDYDFTWRYLNEYLPTHGAILEIGALTGRYTFYSYRRIVQCTAKHKTALLYEKTDD